MNREIIISFWCRSVLGICLLLGCSLPGLVRADLVTSFQGASLDPNLHLDVPDPGVGTITLDTNNHNLLFSGPGADLWDWRNGLPYAWTAIPQVGVGGQWRAETEVQFYDTSPWGRIVGLTTYSGPDGSGGAAEGQQFTFGLDHWDSPNGVWVQGLGNNHPGDSENLVHGVDAELMDLRMDVTVGAWSDNTYAFSFKQPGDADWSSLGTIHDVNDNDRVALFFKGSDMNVTFNYFDVTSIPEPGALALASLGMFSLWLLRFARKLRA